MKRAVPIVLAVLAAADIALAAAVVHLGSRVHDVGEALEKLEAAGGEERLAGLDAAISRLERQMSRLTVLDDQGRPVKLGAGNEAVTREDFDALRKQMTAVSARLDEVGGEALTGRIQEAIQTDRNISGMLEKMPEVLNKYRDKAIDKLGLDDAQAARLTEQFDSVQGEFQDLFTSYQSGQIDKDELRNEFWSQWDGMDEKVGGSLNDWQMSLFKGAKPKILTQWGSWFPELIGGGTRGEALTAPAPAPAPPEGQ